MGDRFAALDALGKFMSGLGWIVLAIDIVAGLFLFARSPSPYALLATLGGVIASVLVVAAGQAIQCLVAIERNTRGTLPSYPVPEPSAHLATASATDETICDACGSKYEGDHGGQVCPRCGAILRFSR